MIDSRSSSHRILTLVSAPMTSKKFTKMHIQPSEKIRPLNRQTSRRTGSPSRRNTAHLVSHMPRGRMRSRLRLLNSRRVRLQQRRTKMKSRPGIFPRFLTTIDVLEPFSFSYFQECLCMILSSIHRLCVPPSHTSPLLSSRQLAISFRRRRRVLYPSLLSKQGSQMSNYRSQFHMMQSKKSETIQKESNGVCEGKDIQHVLKNYARSGIYSYSFFRRL
jgi:hypothetical protein